MHLELSLGNEPRVIPGVRAFVHATLLQFPISASDAEQVETLVVAAVQHAIDDAYPKGEEGLIKLTIREQAGKLEFLVRDFGLPQDVSQLEQDLHAGTTPAAWLHAAHAGEAVDELHWLAFGPEGKALQLVKWLSSESIVESSSPAELAPTSKDVPLAPPQAYTMRRMRPEDAVQVSQLMYRTYGNTYFNDDVYYPERIAAQNAHGVLISVVAVGADGHIAGHCALERNQAGPVAELGQAVVDPAHRGRGLLDQMKALLEQEANSLKLAGWFGDAVAVHTFTQQSELHHGGRACGIDLAISPKSESFRNIAADLSQRVSCVIYFHWLGEAQQRTAFVPPQHREIVAAIYANLQCPVAFGDAAAAPQPAKHGTLTAKFDSRAARATIRVTAMGDDTIATLRHGVRQLVEQSRAEVVFVELPLAEPGTAAVWQALEGDGLAFCGIGPHFSPQGDIVTLVYLVEPLAREPIKTYEPFVGRLVDYALAEQARVRTDQ